ncbi:MAG: hypothetical protein Faunusvirus1_45 [Faunusvirus sp.]|jgi:hypothetical protein|uniref:Uncharacterized protein n=1 Tax=Faunusvirus sp. TaxID=2487766 RepID=A0A3G4ZVV3_9VIRU|nr:MAG: hypothetical protein Faunusvirus1_45 [Faunusvirus sp.]
MSFLPQLRGTSFGKSVKKGLHSQASSNSLNSEIQQITSTVSQKKLSKSNSSGSVGSIHKLRNSATNPVLNVTKQLAPTDKTKQAKFVKGKSTSFTDSESKMPAIKRHNSDHKTQRITPKKSFDSESTSAGSVSYVPTDETVEIDHNTGIDMKCQTVLEDAELSDRHAQRRINVDLIIETKYLCDGFYKDAHPPAYFIFLTIPRRLLITKSREFKHMMSRNPEITQYDISEIVINTIPVCKYDQKSLRFIGKLFLCILTGNCLFENIKSGQVNMFHQFYIGRLFTLLNIDYASLSCGVCGNCVSDQLSSEKLYDTLTGVIEPAIQTPRKSYIKHRLF